MILRWITYTDPTGTHVLRHRFPTLSGFFFGKKMNWSTFKSTYLVRFWQPLPAVIAAGILSAYYFGLTGTFWAVTGEFTRWGGHILQLFGAHPENWGYFKVIGLQGSPLDRIDGMMIIGMFAGCIAAALWANNVKIRLPQHKIRIWQAVAGGPPEKKNSEWESRYRRDYRRFRGASCNGV